MAKRFNGKMISMISNVKSVYAHNYGYDKEIIKELKDDVTFVDVLYGLTKGICPYRILFKYEHYSDSIARERVFDLLSIVSGIKYHIIYKMWLNSDALKDGTLKVEDIK